ncbi:uracil-DNA glycosylase [Rhizobium leguminosarum]|nr:uracil-DNA glycosylase [Rhizobium leguminosarum]
MALGATALYALMRRSVGLTKERGHILPTTSGLPILVTVHPPYLLRIRDHGDAIASGGGLSASIGGHLNA